MDKHPITKKISETLTKWFENVSKRTVRRSYSKAYEKIEMAFSVFENYNARLEKTHPKNR